MLPSLSPPSSLLHSPSSGSPGPTPGSRPMGVCVCVCVCVVVCGGGDRPVADLGKKKGGSELTNVPASI